MEMLHAAKAFVAKKLIPHPPEGGFKVITYTSQTTSQKHEVLLFPFSYHLSKIIS
jgi:hypothetical protein